MYRLSTHMHRLGTYVYTVAGKQENILTYPLASGCQWGQKSPVKAGTK